MSSFDAELEGVSRRISAYMAMPAALRSPDDLIVIHAGLERLRRHAIEATPAQLGGGLRSLHLRNLEGVEARLARVERIARQEAEAATKSATEAAEAATATEPRVAPAQHKAAGAGAAPWTRLTRVAGIGPPRSNPRAAERDRFVAGVGLVIALGIGGIGAALSARREAAEAPAHAPGGPRPPSARAAAEAPRRLTSDQVAELVRKRASADFQAQLAPPPEMRPAAVFRDSRRRTPAERHEVPSSEIALRVVSLRDAFARASQCAVTGGADERTAPDLAEPVIMARREFHAGAASLARVAPSVGPDGAWYFVDLASDPDPVLSSIGRQCLGLARSPEVDHWLADSLRTGYLQPSDTAIEAAVERGGDDLHDAILTLARTYDLDPRARRLTLDGLVRLGRCGDALGLLPLTGDPTIGPAIGHAVAELARRATSEGDGSVVAAIELEIQNTNRRPAPLVAVAAAMGGASAIEVLKEEAQSVDPLRRRAVLDAVAAWPSRPGIEVVATLTNDCDHELRTDARAFLAAAKPAPATARPPGSPQAPQ